MKKNKRKRKPLKAFSGESEQVPLEIIMMDDPGELKMIFSLSNRGFKMIKAGRVVEKIFLKDSKQCRMMLMHKDVYEVHFKNTVDLAEKRLKEKSKQDSIAKTDENNETEVK